MKSSSTVTLPPTSSSLSVMRLSSELNRLGEHVLEKRPGHTVTARRQRTSRSGTALLDIRSKPEKKKKKKKKSVIFFPYEFLARFCRSELVKHQVVFARCHLATVFDLD